MDLKPLRRESRRQNRILDDSKGVNTHLALRYSEIRDLVQAGQDCDDLAGKLGQKR